MGLHARKIRQGMIRGVIAGLAAGLLSAACFSCGDTPGVSPTTTQAADDGPLTGEAALAELRSIFDKYAVNGELCRGQIYAIAYDEYAMLDTSGNGIPADDPNNPYATYDTSGDGLITLAEFEAGEYAAAQANVDTDGSGCVTFEELKTYQGL